MEGRNVKREETVYNLLGFKDFDYEYLKDRVNYIQKQVWGEIKVKVSNRSDLMFLLEHGDIKGFILKNERGNDKC